MRSLKILGLMAVIAEMESVPNSRVKCQKSDISLKAVKKIIPKGVKSFHYGEQVIYAINQKNADRKARNAGLI